MFNNRTGRWRCTDLSVGKAGGLSERGGEGCAVRKHGKGGGVAIYGYGKQGTQKRAPTLLSEGCKLWVDPARTRMGERGESRRTAHAAASPPSRHRRGGLDRMNDSYSCQKPAELLSPFCPAFANLVAYGRYRGRSEAAATASVSH